MPDPQLQSIVEKMVAAGEPEDNIRLVIEHYKAPAKAPLPTKPVSAEDFTQPTGLQRGLRIAKDVGIGAAKGLGSTVAGIGETAVNAGLIPGVTSGAFNPAFRSPIFQKTDDATTASNTAQRVGKVGEQVAEAVLPAAAGANAIPRMGRAATKFQTVMGAAKAVPVSTEAPGQVALRIQELADRGGTAPRAVTKFLRRVTDPEQAPLLYEEGRDWASNISRLSADEYGRLTGPVKREMGNLRVALNGALGDSAGTVGHGEQYASAMKEYAQAAKLNSFQQALVEALSGKAARGIGQGIGLGAGGTGAYMLWKKLAGS
jgi:hypothetical protein